MKQSEQDPIQVPKSLAWRLSRQVTLSRIALAWERIWPALMPALAVIGVYLVISLFQPWQIMPGWLHGLILVGFLVALCWALWHGREGFGFPDEDAAIRRLERDSEVDHRPLTTMLDTPASLGPAAAARLLWQAHLRRVARLLGRLRVSWPAPALAARDPHAIGAAIILFLVIGVAGSGDEAWSRVTSGFEPNFARAEEAPQGLITAWVEQPDYTGLPPVFLTDVTGAAGPTDAAAGDPAEARDVETVSVVAGSVLMARVHGGEGAPVLQVGEEESPFDVADASNFTIELAIESDVAFAVRQGARDLGNWSLAVIHDQVPEISLGENPEQTQHAVLRLSYAARDDFGLGAVAARFGRPGEDDDAEPIALDLSLPGIAPLEAESSSYHDLTPHPWAGLPVVLTMTATDTAGQVSVPIEFPMVLPQREFRHPVAVKIIKQRQRLALDNSLIAPVRKALADLMRDPEAMEHRHIPYLGLRSAYARLSLFESQEGLQTVIDLLWDVALSLEDGELSIAEAKLREAQEALQNALENNASQEELADLIGNLQSAMDEYLELMEQDEENKAELEDSGSQWSEDQEMSQTRNDLKSMLNTAEQLAMSGARDQAKKMLNQMQEMLENMKARPSPQPNQQGGAPMMQDLEEIMSDQDELLDDTFEQAQSRDQAEPLEEPADDMSASDRQEEIRRKLGEVMRKIGERGEQIPDAMGRAERLMSESRDDLSQGRPDRAVEPQAEALQQLQQGAEDMMNQMSQEMTGDRRGQGRQSRTADDQRDPLGRMPPGQGKDPSGFVGVPSETDVQRSREILQELYKRAGQRERPEAERDYIDRLLRWF
jgi:uncharacterized protein (TIGR02302 family)